jgi:A/G-specific adenine glycosylase
VWISEVMLQQTQVATVEPYFERFLAAFPTVADLAQADEQQVLGLWEGLGYYRRARAMHAAARQLVAEHGGHFPADVATLMTLPGIGRYTAGAIVSIAMDRPAPILEANTIRLLCRLLGYREDPTKAAGQRLLWHAAEALLPRQNVADFNQALMELGSLVCHPTRPDCANCPARPCCAAFAQGAQESIPCPPRKLKFETVREAAVVIHKRSAILVRQCGPRERWSGLWDFPRFAIDAETTQHIQRELVEKVRDQTGITILPGGLLNTLKHGVTRFRITLECYEAQFAAGRIRTDRETPARWLTVDQLADLPLSTTGRKIARTLGKRAG